MRSFSIAIRVLLLGLLAACSTSPKTVAPTATPRWLSDFEWLDILADRTQSFEGTLILSAKTTGNSCYSIGQRIDVKLSFRNAATTSLILLAKLVVLPSSFGPDPNHTIFPQLSTEDGESVTFGPSIVDQFLDLPTNPDDFVEIPPGEEFEATIGFLFPDRYLVEDAYAPVPPGNYHLEFMYANNSVGPHLLANSIEQFDWDAWVGKVRSNSIEICIQNP